ncbi:MAG: GNAT family N-acetyltransferase, partial [Anaerolineae bacterium]
KLGLRREGHLRDNAFFRGRWWDTLVYAILEHEWRAQEAGGDPETGRGPESASQAQVRVPDPPEG